MALCCLQQILPEDEQRFEQFHNNGGSQESLNIVTNKRKATDTLAAYVFAGFLLFLFACIGYCMYFGDVDRLLNGVDSCGNVCGRNNPKLPEYPECFGQDFTNKPYVSYTSSVSVDDLYDTKRECVANCPPNSHRIGNECFLDKNNGDQYREGDDFLQKVAEDINLCWRELIYLFLISIVLCAILIGLFRYFTQCIVWIILLSGIFLLIAVTVFLWVEAAKAENGSPFDYTKYVFLILDVILIIIVIALRKRIALIIQLFKEAGKVIVGIPTLLCQSLVTFLALAVALIALLYTTIWIQSAAIVKLQGDQVVYERTALMNITHFFNIFACQWMIQFIIGCQDVIVAGVVGAWYFSRSKANMMRVHYQSASNLINYHLGSVAFGALIITIVERIKNMTKSKNAFVRCCMEYIYKIVKYLGRNAYIQIAMHGMSFCEGGKRSLSILTRNLFNVIAVNRIGAFILNFAKFIVILLVAMFAFLMLKGKEGLNNLAVPICIAAFFTAFVVHCAISIYEIAIDTLLICFCEDSEENDGMSKPYYMSAGLMKFVEDSKTVFPTKKNATPANFVA